MTMKKYKTESYSSKITEVEFVRETGSFITVREIDWDKKTRERREKKISSYSKYHDTWLDAKQFLLERHRNEIQRLGARIQAERSELEKIDSMKQPKEEPC